MTNTEAQKLPRLSYRRQDLYLSFSNQRPTLLVVGRDSEGRVEFNFKLEQYDYGDPALSLEIFSDSFTAFRELPGFFKELYDADNGRGLVRVAAAQRVLNEMGAVDLTEESLTHK
jgi:hypothetical protein